MPSADDNTSFTCKLCGLEFSLPAATRERYPNWVPAQCPACFKKGGPRKKPARPPQPRLAGVPAMPDTVMTPPTIQAGPLVQPVDSPALQAALDEVIEECMSGPDTGLFTDGACSGNPGPGGWGAVWVEAGQIVGRAYGRDGSTTNNRMELAALIAAYRMLEPDQQVTIWSDSQLCVNTITQWAAGWERRGWKRKGGAVKNLELVQEAYALSKQRPRATLRWIKAHTGNRWNEYADRLATVSL